MYKIGSANLPLHYGNVPYWLFKRMVRLGGAISKYIVDSFGSERLIELLSDPYWFQCFSAVLGMDWHSSGTTTTLCGALKEAFKNEECGMWVAGGKGNVAKKTIEEIEKGAEVLSLTTSKTERLKKMSRLSAKIDNNCIQDGYQLYHHTIFFSEKGGWCVVQQGMNESNRYARRYHWSKNRKKFEENSWVFAERIEGKVLNLASKKSEEIRKHSVEIANEFTEEQRTLINYEITLPKHHPVIFSKLSERSKRVLKMVSEYGVKDYEELVLFKGVGGKTLRSLALLSMLIYGDDADWKDPALYSYAHGGKDGFPYPVDLNLIERNVEILRNAVEEKGDRKALEKLNYWVKKNLVIS